jgi:hypothetical protein
MPARTVFLCFLALACLVFCGIAEGAIAPEHLKQIAEVRKELGKVQGLIAKKNHDEAERILGESEQKLKQVASDAGIDENHRAIAPLLKQIEHRRVALKKMSAGGEGRSGGPGFEADVAPILVARCLSCHGADNPRSGLRLDSFGEIVKGCGGQLVVPKKPQESILVQRITATGKQRMPRNGEPLTAEEIRKITSWIAAGAKFTGENSAPLASLVKAAAAGKPAEAPPVVIAKPSGGETVSFIDDIAPFMVNLCVGCHSGTGRGVEETGFSIETFEKLMRGGRGGRVVQPGHPEESRLWHLVGKQDPIKMPPGQSLITRTNHRNLETWIREGAKFDGTDEQAKGPLRKLVLTDAERRAKQMAALSPEELDQQLHARGLELWQAAFRKDQPTEHATEAFTLLGNVPSSRLEEIGGFAAEDAKALQKLFGIKEPRIWRGKLTVFVFKDRFSYSEFVLTNEQAELPAEVKGHSRASSRGDDTYVCLEDLGDASSDEYPGVRATVMSLLTEAVLQRSTAKIPDWAERGLGLALAARHDPKNAYFRGLAGAAHDAVGALEKPHDLFQSGAIAPADLAPVGYTLVVHMMKIGGESQFIRFINQLTAGKSFPEALKAIYTADPDSLARSYMASLGSARPAGKRSNRPK